MDQHLKKFKFGQVAKLLALPLLFFGGYETFGQTLYATSGDNPSVIPNVNNFYKYSVANDEWISLPNYPGTSNRGSTVSDGTYVYVINAGGGATTGPASDGKRISKYNPQTNSWTELPILPIVVSEACALMIGTHIYISGTTEGSDVFFGRYDVTNGTWTSLKNTWGVTSNPVYRGSITYDGTHIYLGSRNATAFGYYNITTNIWTSLTPPPLPSGASGFRSITSMIYANNNIYASVIATVGSATSHFAKYNIVSSTWTWLSNAMATNMYAPDCTFDGNNYLYFKTTGQPTLMYRYEISADTWDFMAQLATYSLWGGLTVGPCSPPVNVSAYTTQTTCNGSVGANNGALILASASGASKVGYSIGTTYTGTNYSSSSTITAYPQTIVNTLSNPSSPQPYTIRIFDSETCFKDVFVTLLPKVCKVADLSLAVSPSTQTGNLDEILSYTFTLTNAGPDTPNNVKIKVPVPANTTLLSASPTQGAYDANTYVWNVGSVPVGTKTIVMSVKVN